MPVRRKIGTRLLAIRFLAGIMALAGTLALPPFTHADTATFRVTLEVRPAIRINQMAASQRFPVGAALGIDLPQAVHISTFAWPRVTGVEPVVTFASEPFTAVRADGARLQVTPFLLRQRTARVDYWHVGGHVPSQGVFLSGTFRAHATATILFF